MAGMPAIPDSTKNSVTYRLAARARERWPQISGVNTRFRGRFGYVVVDSPSLVAKDAALLAGNAQGVVVVARFGHTTAKQLVPAITALTRAGAPLLGSLMPMTPAPKRRTADSYYGKNAPAPGAPSDPPAAHGRHSGPEK